MAKNVFRASFSLSISRGAACALHSIRIHVRSSVCECVCASRIYLLFSSNSLSHVLVGVPISRFQCLRIGGLFGASLFMLPPSSYVGVCACVRQLALYLHICSVFMILLISEHTQLFILPQITYTPSGFKCKHFAFLFGITMLSLN